MKILKRTIILFSLLIFLFSTSVFSAQSVILKSGKTLKGTVTGQNEKGLTIKLTDGTTTTIEKSKILKVVYKDISADEEKKIRAEEEKKLAAKEEADRKKREEAERKKQEAEAKKQAEEEAKRLAEEKKKEDDRKKEIASRPQVDKGDRDRWDIVWRSAVLPSWGMFHADRDTIGYVYSGLFWGTLIYSFQLRSQATNAKAAYDEATLFYQVGRPDPTSFVTSTGVDTTGFLVTDTIFSQYVSDSKSQFRAKTNQYNASLGVVGLIYIVQLVHSYYVGVDWEEGNGLASGGGFDMNSFWEANGVGIELRSQFGYSWRF